MASGINSTFRQVGIATGIAALGAIFQSRVESKLGRAAAAGARGVRRRRLVGGGPERDRAGCRRSSRRQAADAANQAFVTGFNEILLFGAAIALVGGIASWLLVRSRDLVSEPPERPADRRRRGRAAPAA